MTDNSFPHDSFDDLLAANAEYQKSFKYSGLTGSAAKGLAIVTCMDSRINPLSVIGLRSGDAKILRNAGARVTEDVIRTLVLATYLLNVDRILVMPHTDCKSSHRTHHQRIPGGNFHQRSHAGLCAKNYSGHGCHDNFFPVDDDVYE